MVTDMIGEAGQLPNAPKCPFCGAVLDGFTAVIDPDATPEPGDLSICLYCTEPHFFDGQPGALTVRRPTPAEAAALAADPEVRRVREAARQARDAGGFEQRSRMQ